MLTIILFFFEIHSDESVFGCCITPPQPGLPAISPLFPLSEVQFLHPHPQPRTTAHHHTSQPRARQAQTLPSPRPSRGPRSSASFSVLLSPMPVIATSGSPPPPTSSSSSSLSSTSLDPRFVCLFSQRNMNPVVLLIHDSYMYDVLIALPDTELM